MGKDADLPHGRAEKPDPHFTRDGPTVRVHRTQLPRPHPCGEGATGAGPQVGFLCAQQIGDGSTVVWIGDAPVQPAPDRLGVYAQACGKIIFAEARLQHDPA